jgi:hypothetical protein
MAMGRKALGFFISDTFTQTSRCQDTREELQ